jgi:hypothetical protein
LYGYSDRFIGGVQALDQNPRAFEPAVPEPGTYVYFVIGFLRLFGLGLRRWKKRK